MSCKDCHNRGSKSTRYLDPEILGIEISAEDREYMDDNDIFYQKKIVTYSCNYWDEVRRGGKKTSIGLAVKGSSGCNRFIPRPKDVTEATLKAGWLDDMKALRDQKRVQAQAEREKWGI